MESKSIKRLSEFLPRNVRREILELLPDKEDLNVKRDMPKILATALQNYPESKYIIKEEVLEELKDLCQSFNIIGEGNKTQKLLDSLSDKDKAILLYIWKNRHANIRKLSRLISAPTDAYTLTRIREAINPLSKNILKKEILEFKESKVDPLTGDKIMFNWWMTENIYPANKEEMLDIFNEEECLRIVTEVPDAKDVELSIDNNILTIFADNYRKRIPLFYSVEKVLQKTYKNNILEIKLKKEVKPSG